MQDWFKTYSGGVFLAVEFHWKRSATNGATPPTTQYFVIYDMKRFFLNFNHLVSGTTILPYWFTQLCANTFLPTLTPDRLKVHGGVPSE